MTSVLSYMTLDGREVSNSARLNAFTAAGLVPSNFENRTVPCGVLQREAASGSGNPCTLVGFSDQFSQTTAIGAASSPAYSNVSASFPLIPQAGVGQSDGYLVSQTNSDAGTLGNQPAPGGAWADGVVVVAFEPVLPNVGTTITARGRIGANSLIGQILYTAAGTLSLRLSGYVGDLQVTQLLGQVTTLPAIANRRQWLVLRMAGAVITAEWWMQDPRMGGTCFQQISYTLNGSVILNYQTDLSLFGSAGYQGFDLTNNNTSGAVEGVASPEWWAVPVCTATGHLYPSPFLYLSSTLYPDEPNGLTGTLATTPWTDTSRPESSEFLGFYIDDIEGLDGNTTRSIDQRAGGLGGAALGPLVQQGRTIKVHGWIIAQSCRGLDYGREWLVDILAATCHPCPDSVLRLRTATPSPDDGSADAQGLYVFYDVGLTAGPNIITFGNDCTMTEVDFTLTTGNGYKYQASVPLLAKTTFVAANGSVGVQIPTPPGIGSNGSIITISAGSQDLLNVYPAAQLSTYPSNVLYPSNCLYPNDGGVPVTMPILTCPTGFLIPKIPAGGTLIIDSARHRILYVDASGVTQDGTFLLSQATARAIDWLEADACNPGNGDFVLVGASSYGPDATVQVDVQHREG